MTLIKFSNRIPSQKNRTFPVINDLFNEMFENSISQDFRKWNMPAVNIINYDDKFELHLAAPGMKKEDFKLNIEGDQLTISVSKEVETKEVQGNYSRREFQFSSFNRRFTIPDDVNKDEIKAAYENGILLIKIPRQADVKTKSREIKLS